MNKSIVIDILIIIIIISMGYIVVTHQNIYLNYSLLLIILSVLVYIYAILYNSKIIKIIGYIIALIVILLLRQRTNDKMNNNYHFIEWLKILFKNRVVFINVIGNYLLYMPLYYLCIKDDLIFENKNTSANYLNKIMIISIIILLVELLQYIFEIGIFDYIDIFLNILGILSLQAIFEVRKWIKRN